ncbi:adenosine deaminase family protein [Opitutus sp. ER46]|uniref:adenosine deaminase family protein n=1 Tax=Opitutus sp. ER46 TaxID=2161864 RepID=UPI000D305AD0|nr:adenosine deaminase family protein [Opitutus sp. ER46]PTX98909.1 adenosine deaminase [Opitutus sp. ER46]
MRDFIQALPKTETHLHVEGALPYELLTQWQPEQWPPDPQFRSRAYRYPSFPEFDRILLDNALPWFTTADRYHEAAKVMFAKHVAQNVRYVETSFHLPVTKFIKVPGPEIIAALRAAVPAGLEVRIFAGMARTDINSDLRPTIDELHTWDDLAGIDLHGHEVQPTPPETATIWARVRAAGKVTKAHAGEFGGADRVREAIELLGVTRIQHGVRAIEDPAVVRLAAERGVTFDVCPISNVGLQVVPTMKDHPIRRLIKAGVRCTISTDDPLCFGNTLVEEYETLASELTFSRAELAALAKNGWEVAQVPAATRRAMLDEIDRISATTT